MNWWRKFRARRRSDRGDAILVMSVIFVPFFFLAAGFAMDLTKAVYVKEQYQTMGQEATTAAARNIDSKGSITEAAPAAVVQTYQDRFNGTSTTAVNQENGNNYSTLEGSVGVRNSSCTTVKVGNQTYNAPYMVITLSGGRNDLDSVNGTSYSPVYTSEAYGAPVLKTGTVYDPSKRYYTISAVIYDTAPNLMLGMFGVPCQQTVSTVSSITFGSQEDVYDFQNQPIIRTNLLGNPSLESSGAGWAFNSAYATLDTTGTNTATTAKSYVGNSSLKATITTNTKGTGNFYTVTGLTAGNTYTFSTYVYSPTGSPDLAAIAMAYGSSSFMSTKDQWTRLDVTFTPTGTSAFVGVKSKAGQTGDYYIDGAMLEQGSNIGSYFDGSTANTPSKTHSWLGTANLSASKETIQ